ncbi:MAG TPA: hypothetical protein VMT46_20030 [Anaerolineaceae bacterium]|nr:hypothetical protein [Anaerolineaceae bacterium]
MDDSTYDLLSNGRAAAKAGDIDQARFFLEWVLRVEDSLSEARREALYWLSEITADLEKKRGYLEDILAVEPTNSRARSRLAVLDGKVDPRKIVDPDRLKQPRSRDPIPLGAEEARSFTCPKCGGRMTFAPDGESLTCEYCEARERVNQGKNQPVREQDFLLDMLTAKAQLHSMAMQSITCRGCGATFYLLPEQLSQICPYCETAYVITAAETRDLIPPGGLIPFALSAREALRALVAWLNGRHIQSDHTLVLPQGLYVPVWAFRMGGQVNWSGLRQKGREWVTEKDCILVTDWEVLVPASKRYQEMLIRELVRYDLKKVVPYDPRYLVDWPAETYQIPAAEASLLARERTLDRARAESRLAFSGGLQDLKFSTLEMSVETYKLLLLPVWIGRYSEEEQREEALINGQTGSVLGRAGEEGISGWVEKLFGG